jgi:excisionase family DNA binding protein
MSEPFLTVEAAAARLQLHPKTVLRFIHDGRLHATRIGRSWRLRRSDIDTFAGAPEAAAPCHAAIRVTTIADLSDMSTETSCRLATALQGLVMTRPDDRSRVQLQTAYDPEQRRLKVIIIADALDTAAMLQTLHVMAEAIR